MLHRKRSKPGSMSGPVMWSVGQGPGMAMQGKEVAMEVGRM